jgi:uncharacterized protein (TIGR02996 family)
MSLEGFLRAIQDDPEDDAVRLIFADWLDEHGQPDRAEFIRLQVQRAGPLRSCEGSDVLLPEMDVHSERESILLAAHQREWLGEVPDDVHVTLGRGSEASVVAFRRGLLLISLEADMLLAGLPAGLEECLREGWVDHLTLQHLKAEHIPALVAAPWLSCLTSLTLNDQRNCGVAEIAQLAASPHLARLRGLRLHTWALGDEGVAMLASSPNLGRLTGLMLTNCQVGPDGVAAVTGSPHLGRLTELGLWGNHLGDEGAEALAAAPGLRRLRYLDLGHNAIGDWGGEALASCPALEGLQRIDLHPDSGEEWYLPLFWSPYRAGLTGLMLQWADGVQGDALARTLVASTHLRRLQVLHFRGTCLGEPELRALVEVPHLSTLRGLSLHRIGDGGARILAASPCLTRLSYLDLDGDADPDESIGSEGAAALARSPNLASLRLLDLGDNNLGDDAALALARSPFLGNLLVLDLMDCRLGAAGIRDLALSPQLGQLAHLCAKEDWPTDRPFWKRYVTFEAEEQNGDLDAHAVRNALEKSCPVFRARAVRAVARLFWKIYPTGEAPPEATEALAAALQEPDALVRQHAIRTLGGFFDVADNLRPPWLEQALLRALRDSDSGVGLEAEFVLDRVALSDASIPLLVEALASPREEARAWVALSLIELGSTVESAQVVQQLLNHGDSAVAVGFLSRLPRQGCWPGCVQNLRKHLGEVAQGDPQGRNLVQRLSHALNDADGKVRGEAALALIALGTATDRAAEVLRELLGHKELAFWLVERLPLLDPWPGCVPTVRNCLAGPDPSLRRHAAHRLAEAGRAGREVWPVLVEAAVANSDRVVQHMALNALAEMGARAAVAVPSLVDMAREPRLRLRVRDVLLRIGGSEAEIALAKLRTEDQGAPEPRGKVLAVLLQEGASNAARMKIAAIREYRQVTGVSLREARDYVEELMRQAGLAAPGTNPA